MNNFFNNFFQKYFQNFFGRLGTAVTPPDAPTRHNSPANYFSSENLLFSCEKPGKFFTSENKQYGVESSTHFTTSENKVIT